MKITASRYDELKKARDEYDAVTKEMTDRENAAEDRYMNAWHQSEKELEQKVSDIIGPTTLVLDIRADTGGKYSGIGGEGWSIRVSANDHDHFAEDRALSWNWDVHIDTDGNIVKDSGSWSGLKAVTAEQIADLEESVRIIKILNNIDWAEVLSHPRVKWGDYVDKDLSKQIRDRKSARPQFEDDMLTARLEELVGQNILVKLKQDQFYNGPVGILLTGLTDKFVKGYIVPWSMGEGMTAEEIKKYAYEPRRNAKSNVVVQDGMPVETNVMPE